MVSGHGTVLVGDMADGKAEHGRGTAGILNALTTPVLVIDADNRLVFLNSAAEIFLDGSAAVLRGHALSELVPDDSPVFRLIEQVRRTGSSLSDYSLLLDSPRFGTRTVTLGIAPLGESEGDLVITLAELTIANRMHHQLLHRGAARSVTAMAAMLAHEVKNPLSGIRGAAQLLEQTVGENDIQLTRLICNETDRICSLVDRMEVFSDERPLERGPVNLHEVLNHCHRVAATGFGRHVRFVENYDPSLPPVLGNRDILIQAFLNLLKNACEAVPGTGGEIILATAYRHGVRVATGGTDRPVNLPFLVTIQDNGSGIPADVRGTMFDPFVSSKPSGTGLGLAFVAKAVADHGGIIEVDSVPRRTVVRVTLPIADQAPLRTHDRSARTETRPS